MSDNVEDVFFFNSAWKCLQQVQFFKSNYKITEKRLLFLYRSGYPEGNKTRESQKLFEKCEPEPPHLFYFQMNEAEIAIELCKGIKY